MNTKADFLKNVIQHLDMTKYDPTSLVQAMGNMAFQARNLNRAANIFNQMVSEKDCVVYLTLAGSLVSAGLKKLIVEMVRTNMVDVIVSTGANIVDQDFFEALGYHHYIGSADADDNELRELGIDRIYDTYIDEEELRICDDTIAQICDTLEKRPYSSREFIHEMGRYLDEDDGYGKSREDSIVYQCYKKQVPIFVPAFTDSSAGFGLIYHQQFSQEGKVTMDSAADFLELTNIKVEHPHSGLFMLGGGVPKNFTQDVVVATEILGKSAPMHKYAIQITVANEHDGALSGSTLREANSWGKVDLANEQMVYSEATIALPLIAGYVYHKRNWEQREEKRLNRLFAKQPA